MNSFRVIVISEYFDAILFVVAFMNTHTCVFYHNPQVDSTIFFCQI